MLAYEINTRCWLRDLSKQSGAPVTLANVPESEFQSWRKLGFTHVWLMGVWTSGPRSRAAALAVADLQQTYGSAVHRVHAADIAASPYAISAYEVPEALGGPAGLRAFRKRLHAHGIKLLLDFIPNHVGLDHPWLIERPARFINSAGPTPGFFEQATKLGNRWIAHAKDPYFPPWNDTAQLDYRNPHTRAAMLGQLGEIAIECDGVRCDMAMLLLNEVIERNWGQFPPESGGSIAHSEFWADAIAMVKRLFPEFTFVAEVYWGLEQRLQDLGFDFTYNKELYDDLVRRDFATLKKRLQGSSPVFLARCLHFLENHDEQRIAALLRPLEHRLALLLLLSLPGMRLLHEGQTGGAKFGVPVQVGNRASEPVDETTARLYEELLAAAQRAKLGVGEFRILERDEFHSQNQECRELLGLEWRQSATEITWTLLNFSATTCDWKPVFASGWTIERIDESPEPRPADGGSPISIPSQSGVLLRMEQIPTPPR